MIRYVQILGERCSGTRFVTSLVRKNFAQVELTDDFGGKHWFLKDHYPRSRPNETTDAQCLRSIHADTSDTLFLCVVRNPYDWSRSIHARPYHAYNHASLSFSEFLRKPWLSYETYRSEPTWQSVSNDFWFIEEAPNILKLRSMKIEHWLNLDEIVENICFLNYEGIQRDNEVLADLARRFRIELRHSSIAGETRYLGRDTRIDFIPREYPDISRDDLDFMREELNWALENKVGYVAREYPA